jgi:hypothetical protein
MADDVGLALVALLAKMLEQLTSISETGILNT